MQRGSIKGQYVIRIAKLTIAKRGHAQASVHLVVLARPDALTLPSSQAFRRSQRGPPVRGFAVRATRNAARAAAAVRQRRRVESREPNDPRTNVKS